MSTQASSKRPKHKDVNGKLVRRGRFYSVVYTGCEKKIRDLFPAVCKVRSRRYEVASCDDDGGNKEYGNVFQVRLQIAFFSTQGNAPILGEPFWVFSDEIQLTPFYPNANKEGK